MGKLLIGRYGEQPEAESIEISLRDCNQRLGMKPSDFVSADEPDFFRKKYGAMGKYLVFQVSADEIKEAAIWRAGYYLLPLSAMDVLKAFGRVTPGQGEASKRPVEIESKQPAPAQVLERINRWVVQTTPLFFECHCTELLLKLDPPVLFRRTWKARLTCRKRCQPAVTAQF
jgi:hypothetical protein